MTSEETPFFQDLERRIAAYEPPDAMKFGRDRSLFIAAGIGVLLMVAAKYLDGTLALMALVVGLPLQFCALAVLIWRQAKDTVPGLIGARMKFAGQMDCDFEDDESLRGWVASIPEEVRLKRVNYLHRRISSVERRFNLIFGAVDKLGFLPIVAGGFLQVRGLSDVASWEFALGTIILFVYALAIWVYRFRLQIEGYARLIDLDR